MQKSRKITGSNHLKAVIFDCDGVLINTEEIGAYLLRQTFNKAGVPYSAEHRVERYAGVSEAQFKKQLREDFRAAADSRGWPGKIIALARQWWESRGLKEMYMDYVDRHVATNEGVAECLEALKRAGIPFCVASNSDRVMLENKLKKVGLYDYFAGHIYSGDMVEHHKPAPDLYLYAAAQMGVDPEDCAVVDDSVPGVTAGNRAGGYVIGFTGGEKERPDLVGQRLLGAGAQELSGSMSDLKARFSILFPGNDGPPVPQL